MRERDGDYCHFQRLQFGLDFNTESAAVVFWVQCGSKKDLAACHIYRRGECGKVWWNEDVALRGCDQCHRLYDANLLAKEAEHSKMVHGLVRVPPAYSERAYATICANSKNHPPKRDPEGHRL